MSYSAKSYCPFETHDTMWHYGKISRQLGTFHWKYFNVDIKMDDTGCWLRVAGCGLQVAGC